MTDTYIYPAIFFYADDGISVEFPDLPGCCPIGYTTEEAVQSAHSCLALHLCGMERDGEEIPQPSDARRVEHGKNEVIMLVEAFMPPVRERANTRMVKKTLSIPYWLNAEAERAGVNFSAILQNGLKDYLRIPSDNPRPRERRQA
ncbi:MAG: type II toxin-antitoxin system HicB family antitoxin [Peptococcaceae bacterium]|nr:type II toxin-antitoxin system HicB family antitoxin [Peptococcaceae bacterium]